MEKFNTVITVLTAVAFLVLFFYNLYFLLPKVREYKKENKKLAEDNAWLHSKARNLAAVRDRFCQSATSKQVTQWFLDHPNKPYAWESLELGTSSYADCFLVAVSSKETFRDLKVTTDSEILFDGEGFYGTGKKRTFIDLPKSQRIIFAQGSVESMQNLSNMIASRASRFAIIAGDKVNYSITSGGRLGDVDFTKHEEHVKHLCIHPTSEKLLRTLFEHEQKFVDATTIREEA